ncbi:hypothetical protein BGW36DRAFT_342962 [Talaromyces proteolyticus]|uniref:F-box domain-containing protein n=1 Tax=Talaromyces proteolyticus TaxID=1131652 RepID=A0AAD4PZV8_9EURO|nr:uncharacterized protein BGW36DRAFT_342962 [Talaromyces proteolyticus]KAH8696278.1 hypothetical protein BGW36DRAFT_342962 [Talaromyces proteolyticus]
MSSDPLTSAINYSYLFHLPLELLTSIFELLPNRDLKNARLTCRGLRNTVRLRLDRVFISANPRNIKVARAIANDETYRRGIVEIVWDDSLLAITRDYQYSDSSDDETSPNNDKPPAWFRHELEENLHHILTQHVKPDDPDLPIHVVTAQRAAALISVKEAWTYYQTLFQQQKTVLTSGADVSALHYALERFPSLRRVTITPATHGVLFHPLYQTPMIRNFPRELNYPIRYGWLAPKTPISGPEAPPSGDLDDASMDPWHGFRMVTQILAKMRDHHHVTELVLDAVGLLSGISCRIFESPCREYNDLIALLQQPGFKQLDLALIVGGEWHNDWVSFRNGNLSRMLAGAPDLEHIALSTSVEPDPAAHAGSDGDMKNFIPLRSIFPVDRWHRLRHFALSQFLVKQADVIEFLAALPETLRSVELSFLIFLDPEGNYHDMLAEMRKRLGSWQKREKWARPKVVIGVNSLRTSKMIGRAIWIDNEVEEFLYGAGKNPFGILYDKNSVQFGYGVVRDVFEPEFERPYVDRDTMEKLGYYKKRLRRRSKSIEQF